MKPNGFHIIIQNFSRYEKIENFRKHIYVTLYVTFVSRPTIKISSTVSLSNVFM